MELKEYAKKILTDAGCDEYTYGGEWSNHIMDDLKEAFPNGMEFPYVDVANAILEMSRPEPIHRSPWRVCWDTDNCSDGYDVESFEAAKAEALDTLAEWQTEQCYNYPSDLNKWTEKQIEDWDYMYYNCGVSIYKYNPQIDEYEEYCEPSDEELKEIGWMEYEDLLKTVKGEDK